MRDCTPPDDLPGLGPGRAINVQTHPGLGWFPELIPWYAQPADVVLPPSSAWTLVTSYAPPTDRVAAVRGIGGDADAAAAWQNVQWQLRRDGAGIMTFPALGQQFGLTPNLQWPLYMALQPSQVAGLYAKNDSATTTYTVRGTLHGQRWARGFTESRT